MLKKIVLVFSIAIFAGSLAFAQSKQSAHQLNPSCYVNTNGKIVVNAGGKYTTAASEKVYLRDSLTGSIYDTISSSFKSNKRVAYTYDAGGLLTESQAKTIDKSGISWSNSQQVIYKYTGFQLFEETNKNWDKTNSVWVNLNKYIYSYETDNSLTAILLLPWNADSSVFKYSTKDVLIYDASKNILSIANQKWNKNLGSWDKYLNINFEYSGGYVSAKTYQVWNSATQLWDDYQKETYTYSNDKITEVIMQVKTATTSWQNYSRNVFMYENTVPATVTEYLWFGGWKENKKYNYSYDTNSLETKIVTQQWTAHLSAFRNLNQEESYYSQREVIGIFENPVNTFIVKNPISKNEAFYPSGLMNNVKYQMKIVGLNGQTVLDIPVTAGQAVKLNSQIANGIYILSITAPGIKALNQKLLLTD